MFKNIFSFLRQKKILAFVFLFLVFAVLTIPKFSIARTNIGPDPEEWAATQEEITAKQLGQIDEDIEKCGWGPDFWAHIIYASTYIITYAVTTFSKWAETLLLWIIASGSQKFCFTCFDNPAIKAGWPMVRDLANMLIVLGFVIIGIATALRFREYEAKKLLAPLIIAALLVNFSLVITGVFIDGSNIATTSFLKSGGYAAQQGDEITKKEIDKLKTYYKTCAAGKMLSQTTGIVLQEIIKAIVFFLFFFLFLFRYMALWILVILSPLAFVCYVFPFTKKFFEMWWSNFFSWCIIGIPAGLFLFISDKITEGLVLSDDVSVFHYFIPLGFLMAGFLFSLQISAMGAGAAIGAAKWSRGKMGGGAKAMGGALARKTGLEAAGRKVSSAVGGTMERLGLKQTGATATAQAKRIEDEKKNYAAAYNTDPAAKARIQNWARNGKGLQAAAAMEVVAEENDMHKVFTPTGGTKADLNQMNARVAYAQSLGSQRNTFTKKDPRLAQFDNIKIDEALQKKGITRGAKGATATQLADARKQVVREATARQNISDAVNLSSDALEDVDVQSGLNASKVKAIGRSGQQDPINNLRKLKKGSPEYAALIADMKARGVAKGTAEYNQMRAMLKQIKTDPNLG